VHVQDFPARYSPQMGFEGANVLFDTWVHPLMMGLEEHLLHMFRDDFEFHGDAAASHLGHAQTPALNAVRPEVSKDHAEPPPPVRAEVSKPTQGPSIPQGEREVGAHNSTAQIIANWQADAERELSKIPFFVRGKARRNTERYAAEKGVATITVETLYDAKAHFSR
jgi:light-independent protochlorophyllide reductase subunit B